MTWDLQLNWLEHSAHNRAVVGSSPTRSISQIIIILEDYPSPAEGNGLENRQACKSVRGFESHILLLTIAGWSSQVARRAHNPKVVGSNPAPAIHKYVVVGSVAQLVEQWIEAPCVGGSIPSRAMLSYCGCSLVVKLQPSKLLSRVRFSSPALQFSQAISIKAWARSSGGQSARLISVRSVVRVHSCPYIFGELLKRLKRTVC